jgi:hypothetical protein
MKHERFTRRPKRFLFACLLACCIVGPADVLDMWHPLAFLERYTHTHTRVELEALECKVLGR